MKSSELMKLAEDGLIRKGTIVYDQTGIEFIFTGDTFQPSVENTEDNMLYSLCVNDNWTVTDKISTEYLLEFEDESLLEFEEVHGIKKIINKIKQMNKWEKLFYFSGTVQLLVYAIGFGYAMHYNKPFDISSVPSNDVPVLLAAKSKYFYNARLKIAEVLCNTLLASIVPTLVLLIASKKSNDIKSSEQ